MKTRIFEVIAAELPVVPNIYAGMLAITYKEYKELDKQAAKEDVWSGKILVKIPKAGSISDIRAFQCFVHDFINSKF